jgi:hypothetical protein
MKTKAISSFVLACLLSGLALFFSGCSDDDYYIDLEENDFTHFENVENGKWNILFDFCILGHELSPDNTSQFEYHREDQPMGARLLIVYIDKNDLRDRLDGGDVIVDKGFMALYNEKGKLLRRVNLNKLKVMTLLVAYIGHPHARMVEYSIGWENGEDRSLVPPGKYVSQFTIQYNATPGKETKEMKTLTFRKHFEVVDVKEKK